MDNFSRRKFIATAAQGISAGLLAGCNRRIVGPDLRLPSAPKGLSALVLYEANVYKAHLYWTKHDNTDITGAPSESGMQGYNVYCDGVKINQSLVTNLNFKDTSGPDGNGLKPNNEYFYKITAIDKNGNESPTTPALPVRMMPPSPIYSVKRSDASNGILLNKTVIQQMVDSGVKAFTGISDVAGAYQSLFPGIQVTSIVAIKINTLAGAGLSTHRDVVNAIVGGLRQMFSAKFPVENIVVFDDRMKNQMAAAGFSPQSTPGSYKVVSTFGETNAISGLKNWSDTISNIGGTKQRFCKVVEDADYIINVPVLKDHSLAGITFSLKNFFGIIDKPGDMHGAWCDPYIAQTYSRYASKVKLIVGDAICGVYAGGPSASPNFIPNTLLFGKDPVAMDQVARSMINRERVAQNLYEVGISADPAHPERPDARHIVTAAASPHNLGSSNFIIVEV